MLRVAHASTRSLFDLVDADLAAVLYEAHRLDEKERLERIARDRELLRLARLINFAVNGPPSLVVAEREYEASLWRTPAAARRPGHGSLSDQEKQRVAAILAALHAAPVPPPVSAH